VTGSQSRAGANGSPAAVLVPNYGIRHSGVTSVIEATLPHLKAAVATELVGLTAGSARPDRSSLSVLARGFRPPAEFPLRVWHARRNIELLTGIVLRSMLRQPLRIAYSSARQRPYTGLSHWLIGGADAVIATTAKAQSFLHRASTLIPHGVDCAIYRPCEDRAAEWGSLGLGGRCGIGIFGRVRRQKGTDRFVASLIELLPRYPDFTGIVVGLAKASEAPFLHRLKRAVRRAGLERRLLFLGERPARELPRLLASVSICVSPQPYEGFGLVPLEAAACGTPVVATRVGAAPLIVEDGKTGLLVERDDAAGVTGAIERLMRDAELRVAMGRAARLKALREFDIAREVEAYLAVYRSLWAGEAATLAGAPRGAGALLPERER